MEYFYTLLQKKCQKPTSGEVYIHIPFCDSFCHMCACYKTHTPRNKNIFTEYINLLKKEILYYAKTPYVQSLDLYSITLGGGTPTTLLAPQLADLITFARNNFSHDNYIEVTCEGDVRTLNDVERLKALRKSGCYRISFGVQTFDHISRKLSGLVPAYEEIIECIHNLRKYDYKINIDLMFGLPGQDMDVWKKDLALAVELGIDGLDIYETIVYPTTKLFKLRHKRTMPLDNEKTEMLGYAIKFLKENGFIQKSRAVFLKPDNNTRRIEVLQKTCPDSVSIGDSAIGFLNNFSYRNISPLNEYLAGNPGRKLPLRLGMALNKQQVLTRNITVLPKYLKIKKAEFNEEITYFRETINTLKQNEVLYENDEEIGVTESGMLWTDNIISDFISPIQRSRAWKIMY